MIIDSHLYCFEPADQPAGFASSAEHLRWVQAAQAGHHQPAWRIRDREPVPSRVLAPAGRGDLSRLPEVNFRADRDHGRLVWTIDGEDCTKHFYPPNLRNLEFTPASTICEMDYAGVDMALIHTNPMLGRDCAYLAECVRLYPERFRSMAPVDEWRIITETDAVIAELTSAIKDHGLHAIKFNASCAYLNNTSPWDGGPFQPFWDAATRLGVPIFFTMASGPNELESSTQILAQAYLEELRILMRWMARYPDVVCSITHGFPWRTFLDGDRIALPDAIWEPFQNPRCSLEVCFPVRLGDLFEYPYREVWPTLETMLEHIGSEHLLWGTDMPFQNRFCTYTQSRQWIENHCDFLSPQDLDNIMGHTAARILDLPITGAA